MIKAPAPSVDNAGCDPKQGGSRRKTTHPTVLHLFPTNLQSSALNSKRHFTERDGGACVLVLPEPLFLPAGVTNKQKPRLLRAPPPIPAHGPGQTRASSPVSGPYFVSSRSRAWTRVFSIGLTAQHTVFFHQTSYTLM